MGSVSGPKFECFIRYYPGVVEGKTGKEQAEWLPAESESMIF